MLVRRPPRQDDFRGTRSRHQGSRGSNGADENGTLGLYNLVSYLIAGAEYRLRRDIVRAH